MNGRTTSPLFIAPIALINGGPKDLAYNGAVSGYESVQQVTALHAWIELRIVQRPEVERADQKRPAVTAGRRSG